MTRQFFESADQNPWDKTTEKLDIGGYGSASDTPFGPAKRNVNDLLYGKSSDRKNRYDTDSGSEWFAGNKKKRRGPPESQIVDSDVQADARVPVPRTLNPSTAPKLVAKEKGAENGIEVSAGIWKSESMAGLQAWLFITAKGSLKDFEENPPKWPRESGKLQKLLSVAHLNNIDTLDDNTMHLCQSMRKNNLIIPTELKICSEMNTTPHIVGWKTSSTLDQIMIDKEPFYVSYVSYPKSEDARTALPLTISSHKLINPRLLRLHSSLGNEHYENVVQILPGDSMGMVLNGSFRYRQIKMHSQDPKTGKSLPKNDPRYVDWNQSTPVSHNGKTWATNIPRNAIEYTESVIKTIKGAGSGAISIRDFSFTLHNLSDEKWDNLRNTSHKDLETDQTAKQSFLEENQTVSMMVQISGFW